MTNPGWLDWDPKQYKNNGRTLEWGKDLTAEELEALRSGEIFTLLDQEGKPCKKIIMDSFDQIREGEPD